MKLFKWIVMTASEYDWLKYKADKIKEYETYKKIALDIALKKELKKARREYFEYIGKWFIDEREGCVFKIKDVSVFNTYSNETLTGHKYSFSIFSPNNPNFDSLSVEEIDDTDDDERIYTQITEKEAKKHCGFT